MGNTLETVPKIIITPHETIDLGDVVADEVKTKSFIIENKGGAPATFHFFSPDTPTAKMFKFSIDKNTIGAGEKAKFSVSFQSETYGDFSETFKLKQEGSNEMIPIRFTGRVKGPSYRFDRTEIDFENVTCFSCQEEHITLENTSPVPLQFTLRIRGEPAEYDEFEILPYKGRLDKGEKQDIKILFTPREAKKYEAYLSISILHVGADLLSVPIIAESFSDTQNAGHWDPTSL